MRAQSEITTAPLAAIRLSVAIPTFNRNDILKVNLVKLIPQLTSACLMLLMWLSFYLVTFHSLNSLITDLQCYLMGKFYLFQYSTIYINALQIF